VASPFSGDVRPEVRLETLCVHSQLVPEDFRRGPLFVGLVIWDVRFNLLDDQSQPTCTHERELAGEG
jgi:hypothetical protein